MPLNQSVTPNNIFHDFRSFRADFISFRASWGMFAWKKWVFVKSPPVSKLRPTRILSRRVWHLWYLLFFLPRKRSIFLKKKKSQIRGYLPIFSIPFYDPVMAVSFSSRVEHLVVRALIEGSSQSFIHLKQKSGFICIVFMLKTFRGQNS